MRGVRRTGHPCRLEGELDIDGWWNGTGKKLKFVNLMFEVIPAPFVAKLNTLSGLLNPKVFLL